MLCEHRSLTLVSGSSTRQHVCTYCNDGNLRLSDSFGKPCWWKKE